MRAVLADRAERLARRDEIEAIIENWTGTRSKHEVMGLLGPAGVPCGAVLDSAEVMAKYFYDEVRKGLGDEGRHLVRVRVWEAPGCSATYVA